MRTMRMLMLGTMVLVGAAMTAPAARAHETVVIRRAVHRHSARCTWIPARVEVQVERVLLRPGCWVEEVVPAVTRTVLDLSTWRLVRIVVRPATTRRVWTPPQWGERRTRVLVPGRHACSRLIDG